MNLQIVIVAGGMAKRLYPITKSIPKSLVEVAGKPFIFHQLELLKKNKFKKVVLCVGFLGEIIREKVGDGSFWGLHVDYSYDSQQLLGTGGALRNAYNSLDDKFMVLYGDSYLDINYKKVEEKFYESNRFGLMTVYKNNDQFDKSNIIFENSEVKFYDKKIKLPKMEYIDYGLSCLYRKSLLNLPFDTNCDLSRIFHNLINTGNLAGFEIKKRFYEIGSFQGLKETEEYLLRNK
jgi:NDP-sugar pyrophosphorylase family protein